MGNANVPASKPKNKTGKSVVKQKLANAEKTGILRCVWAWICMID